MNLQQTLDRGQVALNLPVSGEVVGVNGLTVWVEGLRSAIGDVVNLDIGGRALPAQVVGISGGRLACMPLGELSGIAPGVRATATRAPIRVPIGDGLLGRIIDALGNPIDDKGPLPIMPTVTTDNQAPAPLSRQRITDQLHLGVRAIDGLVPIGKGQRIGIFAGSGVGKSTLMSMMARNTSADVVVVGLIGERGREVREFIENDLGEEGLAKSVVVVATSDMPPMVRLQATLTATRVAEHFRDAGLQVLLFIDSITRAMTAQREVGLSAGEPPAARAYPPSAFAMLPRLLERAGASSTGSITGIYTVLVEGDDMQDPVADSARSILDGHVVLDRALATAAHYPAIDVLGSVSRVAPVVAPADVLESSAVIKRLLAAHREARILIEVGAYVSGTNPDVDRAIRLMPRINGYLQQAVTDVPSLEAARAELIELAGAA
jgi:flagellum-specific ATP synthase